MIYYVGGNVTDWNAELDKSDLARLALLGQDAQGRDTFTPNNTLVFRIQGSTSRVLTLLAGKANHFDKNPENKDVWTFSLSSDKEEYVFQCLQRPGGGATNNVHVAATLARSLSLRENLELIVSDKNHFVKNILESELVGSGFKYTSLRETGTDLNNVNFRCNGSKISYTFSEPGFTEKDLPSLKENLEEKLVFSSRDMLVVNSIKDKLYLDEVLARYNASESKPCLVAAVTNSMLSKRKEINLQGLVEQSDIYVSNIEEFFDFLSPDLFHHLERQDQLKDSDLYNGMLHILERSGKRKRRVYVTCGDRGVVVMNSDGNLYFQRVSSTIESPTKKNKIVDLNGAGDTFVGVMTLLESQGTYDVFQILDYSNAAAQICIKEEGANAHDRITKESISAFREKHTQDIWKYDIAKDEFVRHCSVKCSI